MASYYHVRSDTKSKMDAVEKELSKIVGLDALKLQLEKWVKGMILDESRRALGLKVGARKPPHMAFLGNPGTGKTSVARVLGKLLHLVGLLPTNKVKEVQRTDLVAEYIGQTGPKTRTKIQEADGGILFVDEAYRFMPKDSLRDFGREALDEIMSFMDTGNIVVIFAGYREPMERVISSNEGFRRRVTKFFYFDDFTCEELAKILHLKMSKQTENSALYGFKLESSCSEDAVAAIIKRHTVPQQRRVMNGGLVDVMLTNARENLDSRIDVQCMETHSLLTITLQDLESGLEMMKVEEEEKRKNISSLESGLEKMKVEEEEKRKIISSLESGLEKMKVEEEEKRKIISSLESGLEKMIVEEEKRKNISRRTTSTLLLCIFTAMPLMFSLLIFLISLVFLFPISHSVVSEFSGNCT